MRRLVWFILLFGVVEVEVALVVAVVEEASMLAANGGLGLKFRRNWPR